MVQFTKIYNNLPYINSYAFVVPVRDAHSVTELLEQEKQRCVISFMVFSFSFLKIFFAIHVRVV